MASSADVGPPPLQDGVEDFCQFQRFKNQLVRRMHGHMLQMQVLYGVYKFLAFR